jgi:hypothetical protein
MNSATRAARATINGHVFQPDPKKLMNNAMKTIVAVVAAWSLLLSTFTTVANAAMVGTQSAVSMEQRAEYVGDINEWLAQETVKNQLVELGVNPADASERVAAMTAEELQTLNAKIDELPAGADAIAVIGIVFLVLLILELVGVTNIFNKI